MAKFITMGAIVAELTLTQVFGSGATQTLTTLSIDKADLTAVGLTKSATNTAESLLIALLLNAARQFEGVVTDELDRPITDENARAIAYNNSSLYELLNIFYWKRQFIMFQSQSKILDTFVVESYAVQ